jgi:hypothetical protein
MAWIASILKTAILEMSRRCTKSKAARPQAGDMLMAIDEPQT